MAITYGHDVELFLTQDGETAISACDQIGGEKKKPLRVSDYLSVLEDGVTIELNGPPTTDLQSFSAIIQAQQKSLSSFLSKKGLAWMIKPSALFSPEALKNPKACTIGCSVDYDAFSPQGVREPPSIKLFGNERFAGGHIHIGLPSTDIPAFVFIRFIAAFVTLPILAVGHDKQGNRRKFYGLGGLFRPTEYPGGIKGIEYRTFSNFWWDWRYRGPNPIWAIHQMLPWMLAHPEEVKKAHSGIPWGDIKAIIEIEDQDAAGAVYDYLSHEFKSLAHIKVENYDRITS
jgi:hypothetical protein